MPTKRKNQSHQQRWTTTAANRQAIERAILAMRGDLARPWHPQELAQLAHMSRAHFERIFKRQTGIRPHHFLTLLRMAEAKRLLVTTPRLVTDISLDVGYDNLSTFDHLFTDLVGLSPTRFRSLASQLDPRSFLPPPPRAGEPGLEIPSPLVGEDGPKVPSPLVGEGQGGG